MSARARRSRDGGGQRPRGLARRRHAQAGLRRADARGAQEAAQGLQERRRVSEQRVTRVCFVFIRVAKLSRRGVRFVRIRRRQIRVKRKPSACRRVPPCCLFGLDFVKIGHFPGTRLNRELSVFHASVVVRPSWRWHDTTTSARAYVQRRPGTLASSTRHERPRRAPSSSVRRASRSRADQDSAWSRTGRPKKDERRPQDAHRAPAAGHRVARVHDRRARARRHARLRAKISRELARRRRGTRARYDRRPSEGRTREPFSKRGQTRLFPAHP